jgi:hypothetical protein
MEPETVVKEILFAFEAGKGPTFIAGKMNRFVRFMFGRILSRKQAICFLSSVTRKLYMK